MKIYITVIVTVFLVLFSAPAYSAETSEELIYFYSLSCDKCMQVKEEVMPLVEARFKDLKILYKDIGDAENYKSLFALKKQYSEDEDAVFPVLFLKGRFIDRRNLETADVQRTIVSFVNSALGGGAKVPLAKKSADPLEYFKTLTLPAVILAGLVDGINPCSFTVMVFFISFLSFQGYKRKAVIASGCAFIMASFLTYLLIGIGLFGPLYAAKGYRAVTGAITMAVGALSIILGGISFYDAFMFLKTKRPEGSILKLPVGIKDKIHRMVGDQYRVQGPGSRDLNGGYFKLFFASLAIGFSISVLESVCTGQLYVPTIIFVLKTTPYKLQALSYLLIYNMMFIIPLVAIFLFALAGVSSQGFAGLFRKYFFAIKILLALIFIALGASLVFAEEVPVIKKPVSSLEPKVITSPPKPKRPNDQSYWDFGKVTEGKVLKHRFYVKNETEEKFRITKVNTSCSCTVSTIEKDMLLPGERAAIDIQFDTKGYPGERTRYTYVHTDSEKAGIIVFEIRAEIICKNK